MGNAAALARITKQIGQLRLVLDMPEDAVEAIADAMEKDINAQLAAGTDPYGKQWKERKDGGKALQEAQKAVHVGAIGNTVIIRLRGRANVLHHLGYARGGIKRQIIPTELTPDMQRTIKRAVDKVAREHGLSGGGLV